MKTLALIAVLVLAPCCLAQSGRPDARSSGDPVQYRVSHKDTLSRVLQHFYGNGTVGVSRDAAPRLLHGRRIAHHPDWLIAGETLELPQTIQAGKRTLSLVGTAAHATEPATQPEQPAAQATMDFLELGHLHYKGPGIMQTPAVLAAEEPVQEPVEQSVSRNLPPAETRIVPKPAGKVNGYEVALDESAARGLPIKHRLNTCIVYSEPSTPEDCHYDSWVARNKQGDLTLKISMKRLPEQPFSLLVAGINEPIDGKVFTDHATPFSGRFPGPRKGMHTLLTIGRIAGNGAIMTLMTGNPIAGAAIALTPPAVSAISHHFAKESLKKAAAKATTTNVQQ